MEDASKSFVVIKDLQAWAGKKIAEATGKLDGWNVENTQTGAKITIYRKDFSHPFIWEVTNKEFNAASLPDTTTSIG